MTAQPDCTRRRQIARFTIQLCHLKLSAASGAVCQHLISPSSRRLVPADLRRWLLFCSSLVCAVASCCGCGAGVGVHAGGRNCSRCCCCSWVGAAGAACSLAGRCALPLRRWLMLLDGARCRCADGCFSVVHSFVQVRVAAAAELVLVLLLLNAPCL